MALVCVLGSFAPRVALDVGAWGFLADDDPVVREDVTWRSRFLLGDDVIVLVSTPHRGGIFSRQFLELLASLTTRLERLPGLSAGSVLSLANERSGRVRPGSLEFLRLLEPMPATPRDYERLRHDIDQIGLLEGTLVSRDFSSAAVLVRLPLRSEGSDPLHRRAEIHAAIRELVRTAATPRSQDGIEIHLTGIAAAEQELASVVVRDLGVLVPISIAVLGVMALVVFRRFAMAVHVLAKALACLCITFGLIGSLGLGIEMTTAITPIMIVATSVSDEVFLVERYRALMRPVSPISARSRAAETVVRAMCQMVRPATVTSALVFLGFFAFTLSPIPAIAHFGLVSALGVVACWGWSMAVTPAVLSLLGRYYEDPSGARARVRRRRLTSMRCRAHPLVVLAMLAPPVALAALGIARLRIQDSWKEMFSLASEFRQATDLAESKLAGTAGLLLFIEWPSAGNQAGVGSTRGALLDPSVLARLDDFERGLESLPGVGRVIGPAGTLKAARSLYLGGRFDARELPRSPAETFDVVTALEMVRGLDRRRQVLADDFSSCAILVLVRSADYSSTRGLLERTHALAGTLIEPTGGRLHLGGGLIRSQRMIESIVGSQVASGAAALGLIFILITILERSLLVAAAAVLPTLTSVVIVLGLMGWMGTAMGVATSMITATSLGVGADFAVYLLAAVAHRRGTVVRSAGRRMLLRSGAPVLSTTLLVSSGIGVLALSGNRPVATLGVTVAATTLLSAFASLVGVPVVLWCGRALGRFHR